MNGETENKKKDNRVILGRRTKKRTTEWAREKLTKANKKQSIEEMQKQIKRKRENYAKRESLRHRNRRPEAVPSLGVAETHYFLLLLLLLQPFLSLCVS
jgi:hypothetical protein